MLQCEFEAAGLFKSDLLNANQQAARGFGDLEGTAIELQGYV